MMIVDFYKIPIGLSLGVVAGILGVSIVASLVGPPKAKMVAVSENVLGSNPKKGRKYSWRATDEGK